MSNTENIKLTHTSNYFDCPQEIIIRLEAMIRHYACIKGIKKSVKQDDIYLLQLLMKDMRSE